jgi:type II secretory pathway predicted ATPase ExeA
MYLAHWGLSRSPFGGHLDPALFLASASHEEALARLLFLVDHRRRLGLLLGGRGSGKSTVLEVLASRLRKSGVEVVTAGLLGMDDAEFVWTISTQLGYHPAGGPARLDLWRSIRDRLTENRYQQLATVLLLDDVDEAPRDVLTSITRLAQLDHRPESRLTLVLSCQAERMSYLGSRLRELCELRIELDAWIESDTAEFLAASLAQCGCPRPVFTPEAAARLHARAAGVPRRVVQLAELSLVAAAGQGMDEVDEETVEAVAEELSVSSTLSMA